MNREILFRGKAVNTEKWLYGDLVLYQGHTQIWTTDIDGGKWNYLVESDTVGQYTGMTDKNGTKIFEGDILQCAWNTKIFLYYDDYHLQFRGKEISTDLHPCEIDYYGYSKIEVIGNIHDNPELLKGADHG